MNKLLKLRIENVFLKELRRLRLEDNTKMREQQESAQTYMLTSQLLSLSSYLQTFLHRLAALFLQFIQKFYFRLDF